MNILEAYNILNTLYEDYSDGYLEIAKPINLKDCREIVSDVLDIRNELEASACLDYNGVLTRVAAKVLIFRDGLEGKEVLLRLWRTAVYLPGGGFDLKKDNYNIINTVKREVEEEINLVIDNIRPTSFNYWRYDNKAWVVNHVKKEEDRWLGYYNYLFTADYKTIGDNDLPEEAGRYRWHKVSDILARPDTKELACIKKAIIENGYADLNEGLLTEGKSVGLVSYYIHDIKRNEKTNTDEQPALAGLAKVLSSETILASTDSNGDKYVSTSRDLVSHLGPAWKCGVILDGDKLSDRYKIHPIDYNSMLYFELDPDFAKNTKHLELRAVSKFVADDDPSLCFYNIDANGNRFFTEISETTYNILKDIMLEFNAELAVDTQELGKGGKDKYKGRTIGDVKKYTTAHPVRFNKHIQNRFLHNSRRDHSWTCVESVGYNVPNSRLVLTLSMLEKFKDKIMSKYNIDITSREFFNQIGGRYADEAEERIKAKRLSDTDTGINIRGCIKAIVINIKHKPVFDGDDGNKFPKLADDDGNITAKIDNIPNIRQIAKTIKNYAESHSIPIIFWNRNTTSNDILRQIN